MITYDVLMMSEDDFFGTIIRAKNVPELCKYIATIEKWREYEISEARIIPDTDPIYFESGDDLYKRDVHICPECDERDHEIRMANEE